MVYNATVGNAMSRITALTERQVGGAPSCPSYLIPLYQWVSYYPIPVPISTHWYMVYKYLLVLGIGYRVVPYIIKKLKWA